MKLRIIFFLLVITNITLFATTQTINGTAFVDADKDGTLDSDEDRLSNIHIRLFKDVNNDGLICPHVGDSIVAETDTDSNGNYQFDDIEDGDYLVQIMVNDPDIPSGSRLLTTNPIDVTIDGQNVENVNFGFSKPTTDQSNTHDYGDAPSSYPGGDGNSDDARHRVVDGVHLGFFIDVDGDGSAGDDVNSDDALADDNTDADDEDGVQLLTPLIPGKDAKVRVLAYVDSDYSATLKGHFDLDGNNQWYNESDEILINDSDVKNGVNFYTFTIPADATNGDDGKSFVRFKYYDSRGESGTCCWGEADSGEVEDYEIHIGEFYTISGTLFEDTNKNGEKDSDESGISNVKVGLYKDFDRDGIIDEDDIVQEVDSDENGNYIFSVPPNLKISRGDYVVIIDTNDSDIPENLELNGANPRDAFMDNQNVEGVDFPFIKKTYCLGDMIWEDSNNNGIQDNNESGISNITVTLYDSNDNNLSSTTTDSDGLYKFCNLDIGDYSIKVDIPSGYIATTQDSTSDESIDSDIDSNGKSHSVSISDSDNFTLDAGLIKQKHCLGDFIWFDNNKNGIQDKDEQGVSDINITLYDSNNVKLGVDTTNGLGKYKFCNLKKGEYYIVVDKKTLPKNYIITIQNANNSSDVNDSDIDPNSGKSDRVTIFNDNNYSLDGGIYKKEIKATPTPTPIVNNIYTPIYTPTPTPTPTPEPTLSPTPTPIPEPITLTIEDDIVEANQEDSVTVINVLNNDMVDSGVAIKLVKITDGDIIENGDRAVSGANLETVDSLVVEGEGVWRVDGDKIVFIPEKGFSGTPTPIYYIVKDEFGNYSNLAKVMIKGNCLCKPFESKISDSVPTNYYLILILILITPLLNFFLRKKISV